jgi:alanine dehydrogenase
MAEVHYVSNDDVADLVDETPIIDAVRAAYVEHGNGAPISKRIILSGGPDAGAFTGYLGVLPESAVMGAYVYNYGFDPSDVWLLAVLFDTANGQPIALVDGASMNPLKTGGSGAVGADALAREDATKLGVIGTGAQAWGQILMIARTRDLSSVRVYSPTQSHRESFAGHVRDGSGIAVAAVNSAREAVCDADIVVTATTAEDPVFDGADLQPGTHVNAIGQYHPEKRELDVETVARSKYVIDMRDRLFEDAGSYIHAVDSGAVAEDHVHAELGEILTGARPGRDSDDEITVYDSGGTAIESLATANAFYEAAKRTGKGQSMNLFTSASESPIYGDFSRFGF